jgi:amino acid permease
MSQNNERVVTPPTYGSDKEKGGPLGGGARSPDRASISIGKQDHVHRTLKARHIQLIGIGGTIGTALFVRTIPLA